jgi:hypothetical protein
MPPVIAVVGAIAGAIGAASAAVVGAIGLAGVASTLGISAFGLLTTVASIGVSLLKGGNKSPPVSKENQNRLRANIDVRTGRKTVIGTTAMATDIRDEEFTGADQDYFHRFIVCASHKVNAISEIWFDDKQAWTLAGGVQGEFVGYLTVAPILEGSSGNAINISSRMGTTRRYTGCAYVHLRYKLTGNSSKVDSPFAQSVTTRITIIGNGAYVYDPRLDSTVAGGSGAHRADNQATWAWSTGAGHNPALALLFYLIGWKIGGNLAIGKGIPKDRIDLESFAIAANICDESVAKVGGGTEARYRVAGVWSEGDAPNTVIDMLKASMNADLDDVDGKLRLTIFKDDGFASDADFTADDLIGQFEWDAIRPLDQSFNIVRGTHTDASTVSLYQQVDYPQISVANLDGIDRILSLELPMVESVSQCQRIAGLRLKRESYSGTFRAEFQATAWRVEKNSIVRLTFAPLGFVNKTFRVAEMEMRVDGIVPLTLVEEDPAIYVAPALNYGVAGVDSTEYDPSKNPIIDALTAPNITLSATTQIITYDSTDALDPSSQTNTFSIDRLNSSATCNWTLEDLLGNTLTAATYLSAIIGDSVTMTAANFSAAIAVNDAGGVRVIATVIEPGNTLVETINVYKLIAGSNALVGFLTNADVSLSASSAGVVSSFATATGTFKVYLGITDVTTSSTFAEVLETNCTGTTNASTGVYAVTTISADNAAYKMSATYGAYPAIEQVFTLSKSNAGANGTSTAQIYLYQRASSAPAAPTGTFTYTFATAVLSGGTPGAWTQAIPAADGNPLYVIVATAVANTATDTIAAAEFSGAVIDSGAGLSVATATLYQRATSSPSVPGSTLTYTFATGVLSGTLGSWTQAIPSGTNPIYTIQATAVSTSATDTITSGEWSAPVIMAQNGAAGTNGTNGSNGAAGANGTRTAVLYMYKWLSTTPATFPSGSSTYTWATGQFTDPGTLNGWSRSIGTPSGGDKLWRVTQIYSDTGTSSTSSVTWSASSSEQYTPTLGDLAALNAVNTIHINSNQVTLLTSAYTQGAATFSASTWTAVQTVTFTATGAPCAIKAGANIFINSTQSNVFTTLRVRRGSTNISGDIVLGVVDVKVTNFTGTVCFTDTPSAGSVTYTLEILQDQPSSDPQTQVTNRYLEALETKR